MRAAISLFAELCRPAATSEVISMQRFVAELSTAVEKAALERSWRSDQSLSAAQLEVQFVFDGLRVSTVIDSDDSNRWSCASFYRTFSAAVRRIDGACNIRWL
jgi:hypothetical protein